MIRGYRVWDNQEKTYSDKAFSIDQLGICYVQDKDGYWEEIDDRRFIVEFETGLTDKNADMIYEGDIVKIRWYGVSVVFWYKDSCGFWFNLCDKLKFSFNEMPMYNSDCKTYTVIGNIHENPELLEVKK